MPIVPARSGDPCQHRAVPDDELPPQSPQPDTSVPRPDEPESAYELLQRGTALMRRRHNAQAAVVLERAARLEPGKGSILEALGRACFTSGQYERARETFEALLEVDPSSHYGHYALGRSLKNLGRPREARTHLRLAVALSPTTAMYRAALARLPAPEERERS
jgi:Flp pilus assembly protein TadD